MGKPSRKRKSAIPQPKKEYTEDQYNEMMERAFQLLQDNEVASFPCGGYSHGCKKTLTCRWDDELDTLIPVRDGESIEVKSNGTWNSMIVCDLCISMVARSGLPWKTVYD